jgi:HlyD family secretion protein
VAVDSPTTELRPGLSATAKITTARRENVLAIPIQALTLRTPSTGTPSGGAGTALAAQQSSPAQDTSTQGVFILRPNKGKLQAEFVPVSTGITGATDIEVTGGVKQGDEIVIGAYQTLRNLKSGTMVKRDQNAGVQKDAVS